MNSAIDERICRIGQYSHRWTVAVIALSLLAIPGINAIRGLRETHPIIAVAGAMILVFAVYIPPFLAIACSVISYRNRARSLPGLISLYVETIVLFAFIYFLFALLDNETTHLKGIHQVWWSDPNGEHALQDFSMNNALYALLDCFHFSVVTAATVGYGDMLPNSPKLKLLVDLQILASTALVALGIGNFFSSKGSTSA